MTMYPNQNLAGVAYQDLHCATQARSAADCDRNANTVSLLSPVMKSYEALSLAASDLECQYDVLVKRLNVILTPADSGPNCPQGPPSQAAPMPPQSDLVHELNALARRLSSLSGAYSRLAARVEV